MKILVILGFVFFHQLSVVAQSRLIVPGGMRMTLEIKEDTPHKFVYVREIKKCVMWDKASGRQLYSFVPRGESKHMQLSHNGATLLLYDDFGYSVFSTITGTLLFSGANSSADVFAFSLEDSFIWSLGDDVKQINTKSGDVKTISSTNIYTINGELYVQNDGNLLIVNSDGCQLYQANPFAKGKSIPFSKLASKTAYVPKSATVAALQVYPNKASVELYSIETGKQKGIIENPFLDEYSKIIPSADDNTIICTKNTPLSNNYAVYNASTAALIKSGKATGILSGPWLGSSQQLIVDRGYQGENINQSFATFYLNSDKKETVFSRSMMFTHEAVILNAENKISLNQQLSFNLSDLRGKKEKLIAFSNSNQLSADGKVLVTIGKDNKSILIGAADGTGQTNILPVGMEAGAVYFISSDGSTVYYSAIKSQNAPEIIYSYTVATKSTKELFSVVKVTKFAVAEKRDKIAVYEKDYGKATDIIKFFSIRQGQMLWSKKIKDQDDRGGSTELEALKFANDDKNLLVQQRDLDNAWLNNENGTVYTGKETVKWIDDMVAANSSNDFITPDEKLIFTLQPDLSWQVTTANDKTILGTLYVFNNNGYVFVDQYGRFDGTPEGIKKLYYVRNRKIIPLDLVYEKYYTPSLYQRLLNGEQFGPVAENTKAAPSAKMAYEELTRNLEVGDDDVPTYINNSGFAAITVTAMAPEDAVDEIRLFHNGKIVTLTSRNLIVEDDKTNTAIKKYKLTLLPGNNNIKAIALNTERTESHADEIIVTYKNENVPPQPSLVPTPLNNTDVIDAVDKNATLYLMVVGINAYSNKINPLTYALPDAKAFKEEIEKDAQSVLSNVKTFFVSDATADRAGIINVFNQIKAAAKPQDVLVFYYAGHGYINPANKEFYLVSSDVTDAGASLLQKGIPAKELQQYAVDIQAQKQLFILDACQSAGAFDAMLKHDGEQQKSLAVVARSTGTHWMAASGSLETAKEFSQLGHGAFTYVLLQALQGQAAANKMITVNGLKNFLQVQVPELVKKYGSNNQYPASYGSGNDFPVEIIK